MCRATRLPSALLQRESATILDTWHTLGMRGTGSADIAVTDLFVPEHLTSGEPKQLVRARRNGSLRDSLLEEDGFELSIPRKFQQTKLESRKRIEFPP